MNKIFIKPGILLLLFFSISFTQAIEDKNRMSVSENGHYLIDTDGNPFYWIGDTGWAMFQRLTREQIDQYLDDRCEKGFNLIQSVAFWYPYGEFEPIGPLNETNAYGFRPFTGSANSPNTSDPFLVGGGSIDDPNDYWDHADYVVEAVKKRRLKLVLLPCWANAFINNRMKGSQIEFTVEEALLYGKFLGEGYKNEPHIIWCLGGDVDPVNFGDRDQRAVYRTMAEGIGRGVSGNDHLKWNSTHKDWNQTMMTFHAVRSPQYSGAGAEGGSSSLWFHDDAWLDFNMMETFSWRYNIYPYVTEDYHKVTAKPTLLGEGAYEGGKYNHECGYFTPLKVRQQGYHAFFAGGAGYTTDTGQFGLSGAFLAKLTPAQADVFLAPRPAKELFDVRNDPQQLLNLASVPKYQEKLKEMRTLLKNWQKNTGDTTPDDLTPDWYDRETGKALDTVRRRGTMPGTIKMKMNGTIGITTK
jgi:hypothetical protein